MYVFIRSHEFLFLNYVRYNLLKRNLIVYRFAQTQREIGLKHTKMCRNFALHNERKIKIVNSNNNNSNFSTSFYNLKIPDF